MHNSVNGVTLKIIFDKNDTIYTLNKELIKGNECRMKCEQKYAGEVFF